MTMTRIEAYHGTGLESAQTICKTSFNKSEGENQWLGDGVYFFVDGISDPKENASKWAVVNAWDKKAHKNKYDKYGVLLANIDVNDDDVFDMRREEIARFFNEYRNEFNKKIIEAGRSYEKFEDANILNEMREFKIHPLKVVVAAMYVKLTKDERILKIESRLPNTTICSVNDENCIKNARIVKTGDVE